MKIQSIALLSRPLNEESSLDFVPVLNSYYEKMTV